MQALFHEQQLFAVALHQLAHRNTGSACHHFGNFFGAHLGAQQLGRRALATLGPARLGVLRVFEALFQGRQLAVLQFGHLGQIAFAGQRVNLLAQAVHLGTDLGAALRSGFFGLPNLI